MVGPPGGADSIMTSGSFELAFRVLLVDPGADTRRLYSHCLRGAGCEVDEASDGREALAKALSRHYDVVITETRVPGIDGYHLCELLRRDRTTHTLPLVVVTGEGHGNLQRVQRTGADVVLRKPCLPETLLLEMRHLLHESRNPARPAAMPHSATDGSIRADDARSQAGRRFILSRAHQRGDTRTPPARPPDLLCPRCDSQLTYQRSHVGGVSARHPEQWDYYECRNGCGTFVYRQRTRKLRSAG
jgi:two-component system, cell cycle response regulator DivK